MRKLADTDPYVLCAAIAALAFINYRRMRECEGVRSEYIGALTFADLAAKIVRMAENACAKKHRLGIEGFVLDTEAMRKTQYEIKGALRDLAKAAYIQVEDSPNGVDLYFTHIDSSIPLMRECK